MTKDALLSYSEIMCQYNILLIYPYILIEQPSISSKILMYLYLLYWILICSSADFVIYVLNPYILC